MNSVPLLISALGGAVAALLLRTLLKLIGKWWVERKPLAIYKCADAHPAPLSEVHIGFPIHGKGLAVADDKRASYGRSWEHTAHPAEGPGVHTIYGPYVNDFGKPGFYRVCFRICGDGFKQDDDTPILILDIIHRPAFLKDDLVLMGQRIVRAKELSPEYKDFDIYCYVAGIGNYEYRCLVISDSRVQGKRLRFDTISVYSHVPNSELF